MKKFLAILFVTAILLSTLTPVCFAENEKDYSHLRGTSINVYNWGEYISDGSEGSLDVNKEFTKRYGIKVNYTTFESNENMYNKLQSGGANYDVVIPSDYMIAKLIEEDMLVELDYSNIPNYQYILPKYKNVSVYIDKGFGKYYDIVIAFLVVTALQTIYIDGGISTDNGRFQIFVATTAVFFVTYAALFSSLKDTVELAKEKRKQIHTELLETRVQAQENEVMWARKSYHDIRHHNDAILAMAKTGDLDSIIRYLEKQSVENDGQHNERFCENETINNVLRVYSAKAKSANIRFSADAAAKKETPVSSHDLVAILANVVENALHGAIESNAEDPMISVNIYYKAKKMVIVCENSCNPFLVFAPDMPSEMWGVGIHSIVSTAEKYGGTCRFTAQNGVFTATVALIS